MHMIGVTHVSRPVEIVRAAAGETLWVDFIDNIDEGVMELVRRGENLGKLYQFKTDAVVAVDTVRPSFKTWGCKHLRHVRVARPGLTPKFVEPNRTLLKLRAALRYTQTPTVRVPGGFELAIGYGDEIAVANYSMSGSSGWILNERDTDWFIDQLPPLKPSHQTQSLWVEHVGWANTPDECHLALHSVRPVEITGEVYDRPAGHWHRANAQILRVDFDTGTRRVVRLYNETHQKEVGGVTWSVHPVERRLKVGDRVPRGW